MKKADLLKLVETMKDEDSVDSLFSFDKIKDTLTNDSTFKSYLDSEKDKHHSKALETWKTNNLNKLIDDEVKKRFPEADPKDIELKKMKAEIEQMKQESLRKDLTNKAIKIATDKKLPVDFVDYLIGKDEETTISNLTKVENVFNTHLQTLVQAKLQDNNYVPPTNDGTKTTIKMEDLKNMTPEQINANWDQIKDLK